MQVPTVRPSKAVDGRPACCGSDVCTLCPVDSKGTALNMVFPAIRERVELRSGLLAVEIQVRGRRVEAVTAIDPDGATQRITARHFVIASNGVDSCLLLQRSPEVPKHETLGRCYMDHASFELAIYGSGLDARPGYGNSAQTGMITSFFESVSPELPVSVLGEIRFSDPVNGNTARPAVLEDVTRLAIERRYSQAASFRQRFEDIWRSTLYLRFLVETQPLIENTVGIHEMRPSGQADPARQLGAPAYFDGASNTSPARSGSRCQTRSSGSSAGDWASSTGWDRRGWPTIRARARSTPTFGITAWTTSRCSRPRRFHPARAPIQP